MRTTVDLNDEILRQAKRRAADEGTSVKRVIEDALRVHLGRSAARAKRTLRWRTEKGRLLPGVRIEEREALFDLMGQRQ